MLRKPSRHCSLTLVALLVTLALLSATAFAALYTIDTNDMSVAEWEDQGIVEFMTDPAGDVLNPDGSPGGSATDDIIGAWVASGTDPTGNASLFFRVEMAQPPASSGGIRGVVAVLDCDRNGVGNERQDRLVTYYATGVPVLRPSDSLRIFTGDMFAYYAIGSGPDKLLGQRVGRYLEWAVPISDLPIIGTEPPELEPVVDCRHDIEIRFLSVNHPIGEPLFRVLDETEPLLGWRIPQGVPISATLTIAQVISSNDVLLEWNPTAQSVAYQVLRSTLPYSDTAYAPISTTQTISYTDVAVLGSETDDNYFYQVQGEVDGTATVDPSNRVGFFEYGLVPGNTSSGS